jgi:hypothetical protein
MRNTAALAPWIRTLRRYTLSRLLMPNSFALPPVEYWRGTMPSHAAKSLPIRKAAPLPIAATMAVATTGPIPGNLTDAGAPCIAGRDPFQLIAELFDLLFNELPLTPQHVDQVPHLGCQIGFCVLQDVSHRGLEPRWLLRKHHAAFE